EITGTDAASHGEFLPPEVGGIPIHQTAQRVHLLHGAMHGHTDGAPLANLVLHFQNGATRQLRIVFGVHARNAVDESGVAPSELADPNSKLVWQSTGGQTKSNIARLYKTVFDNPWPEQEIV